MPRELPSSLVSLLSLFRGCFTQPTFQTFCALSGGLLCRVRARTVCGMLLASGFSSDWHHSRAHRFFSRARWSVDKLGLVALTAVCDRLLADGDPVVLAVDDTLLLRTGPKVFGRCLHYDPALNDRPRAQRTGWGNSWVVLGVVVELAFLKRPVCLPVLFRLWRPGQGPTQVEYAAELVELIARALPHRRVVVLGDGGYAGGALTPAALPDNVTLLVRARCDLRLCEPCPARKPKQNGRPRLKGPQLPALRDQARTGELTWQTAQCNLRGHQRQLQLTHQTGLWWRAWRQTPTKATIVRDPTASDQIDLVLITNDPTLPDTQIVELYAKRWAIEVTFRDAKQLIGTGEAQNRTPQAVKRTAPFAFLNLTIAILWYATHGHDTTDLHHRRATTPWYRTKHHPSTQDMLAKLRRTIIAHHLSTTMPPHPQQPKPIHLAELWDLTAA